MSFDTLGLRPELLSALASAGYTTPTPIQEKAIPVVLSGRDVLAAAQTGTGKTAGFTLPLLQRLMEKKVDAHPRRRPIRALILTPTRELAAQVQESVDTYGKGLPLRSAVIFGGVKMGPQLSALNQGVDILVATPGRLLDHVNQRTADLSRVEIFVLDEADRMLDMGFIHDIKKVLALLPGHRQNLLFSATFSEEIKNLADKLLHSPTRVEVARQNAESELVTQGAYYIHKEGKRDLLVWLLAETYKGPPRQAARARRNLCRRDPRRPEPAAADQSSGGLQVGDGPNSGCDRHRGAWPGHRSAPARDQLRASEHPRGLRPPHRTNRSRGQPRRGRLAGLRR
jgi:ATP-dependent RNA helicase RhlE